MSLKYNDLVEIMGGFYEGQKGHVIEEDKSFGVFYYKVKVCKTYKVKVCKTYKVKVCKTMYSFTTPFIGEEWLMKI